MQATSSPVTSSIYNSGSVFSAATFSDEAGSHILPALKKAASDAGRDHLLVRRRRRGGRRSAR